MGWYLRKSFAIGPLRLNLSKSGLGYSVGVKGARIGTGPRGNYVHLGRYGVYYRHSFSLPNSQTDSKTPPHLADRRGPFSEPEVHGTAIATADVSQLVNGSADELLSYITSQHSKHRLAPIILALAGLLLAMLLATETPALVYWLVILASLLAYVFVRKFDRQRKLVVLNYRLDEIATARYTAFLTGLQTLHSSKRLWRIATSDASRDIKYTSGATDIVKRENAPLENTCPPFMEVDVAVWKLSLGRQVLYFFPDRILIYEGADIASVPYGTLSASFRSTRFVETETVPGDTQIVDHTWRYVNRNGGPDHRFANNRQIPVALYAEIQLTSTTGMKYVLHCSNVEASRGFAEEVKRYCSTLNAAEDQLQPIFSSHEGHEPEASNIAEVLAPASVEPQPAMESSVAPATAHQGKPASASNEQPPIESTAIRAGMEESANLESLKLEVKSFINEMEVPLKAELRKVRTAGPAREFLEQDIRALILHFGFNDPHVSPEAAGLHLVLFRYLHPRTYAWDLNLTISFMEGIIQKNRELYLGSCKRPFTLNWVQSYDTLNKTNFAEKMRQMFFKIAVRSSVKDGEVSKEKQAVLAQFKLTLDQRD